MDSSKFKKVDEGNYKKNRKSAKNYRNNKTLNQKNYKNNRSYNKNSYRKNNSSKNNYYKRKENNKLRNSKREYLYSTPDKKNDDGGINFKVIAVVIVILALLGIGAFTALNMLNDISYSSLPSDAVLVYPSDFDFKPDGYYFDDSLCGSLVGTNENGTQLYFLTKEQVFALAYNSNNTFNYSDGIYVTYKTESSIYNDINVVNNIYLENGKQLSVPENYDSTSFIKNSKNIASKTKFCSKTFGYSGDDYYKIY